MSGRIAVVDAGNRFLRWASREEIHAQRLSHRSVQVLLFDSQGRLVLQRRASVKRTYPDCLDVSASGHVEESDYPAGPDERLDEVYDAVAARELEEELGVRVPLTRLFAEGPIPRVHYEELVMYRGASDGPYVAQVEEVSEIRAVTRPEFESLLADPHQKLTDSLRSFATRGLIAWPSV
jgi:isopentenyldiphosphate isomerase